MIKQELVEKLSFYCLDELKRLSGGDHSFIADIIKTITEACPGTILSIETHFQSGDLKALAFILHKFKSTVNIVGNKDLTAMIAGLELKAKNRVAKELIQEDIENLISAVKILTEKLRIEAGKFN